MEVRQSVHIRSTKTSPRHTSVLCVRERGVGFQIRCEGKGVIRGADIFNLYIALMLLNSSLPSTIWMLIVHINRNSAVLMYSTNYSTGGV